MPAEISTRYATSTRTNFDTPIRPSLFIGLGGSGKEVLMRLRRLFYTNSRTTGLPVCEYLWIDTDPSNRDIDGQDYDDIFSKINLNQNDLIRASIPPSTMQDYFNRPGNYSHIYEWLHQSIQNLGPNMLEAGAGGIRACGRLAFWHHYSEIRRKILQKLNTINDALKIQETESLGFQIEPQICNIFLVGSLAGGTGAGMFLDTAFSLNSIAHDINRNLFITGIFFLPSVFEGKLSRGRISNAFSTAYASLMEMDFFNSPVSAKILNDNNLYHSFTFKWDGFPHEVYSAPMHTIYLVAAKNSSGIQLHSYSEAFQMAAESIHLEFCQSDFGMKKRSVRVNLQEFLINETLFEQYDSSGRKVYSNYFPNRYSSLGLSFVKLDVDRRKNAAAYIYAKSLVTHWCKDNTDTSAVKSAVDRALTVRRNKPDLYLVSEGLSWNADTIWKEFLILREGKPEKTSMLNNHIAEVKSKFQAIKESINAKFTRKKEALADVKHLSERIDIQPNVSLWEDTSDPKEDFQSLTVILKEIHPIWDSKVNGALNDLAGRHKTEITANANLCLKLMRGFLQDEFYYLISKPGLEDSKAGTLHADVLCTRYLSIIEEIQSQFIVRATAERNFVFNLESIKPENDQIILSRRRNEARALKAPLFSKTAVTLFDSAHKASVDKHLSNVQRNIFKSVELQETKLVNWLEDNYWNHICISAVKILGEIIKTVKELKNFLQSYLEGLKELSKNQQGLFNSFNKNIEDIRNYSIDFGDEEVWYQKNVLKCLEFFYPNAAAMTWEMLLDNETDAFIKKLAIDLRIEGFKQIFKIVHERTYKIQNWQLFISTLEEFSFNRIYHFLEDTNADIEFQKSNAPNKMRNLEFAAKAGDIWISSNQPLYNLEDDKYIGIPSMEYTTTANNICANSPHLSDAQQFTHDKGNIVIYKEGTAFPLFHISELERCRQEYENDSKDLTRLFYRHIDYRHIYKLKEIEPPKTEREAIELFEAGVLLLQGILLGCCSPEKTPERQMLRFSLPPSAHKNRLDLGPSFEIASKSLMQHEEVSKDFRKQKDHRIRIMKENNRQPHLEMLCLAGYYTQSVFPTLQRAGFRGITNFDTNTTLISKELRRRLTLEAVTNGDFVDSDDPNLWKTVERYNIENISDIFPFNIPDAQAPLRRLKV